MVSISDAAKSLEASLQDNPGEVAIAALTASIYRQYSDQIGPSATADKADQIMDELVAADPRNVEALVARYKYLSQYHPERARADLDAALVQDPDHVESLLLDIEAALSSGDTARLAPAKANGKRLIAHHPLDPRGYIGVARIEASEGAIESAIDTLTAGRKSISSVDLDLDFALAGLLIDSQKMADAKKIAAEFSSEVDRRLPQSTTFYRTKLENQNRVMRARLAVADGDFIAARRELDAVLASTGKSSSLSDSIETLSAHDLLASIASQDRRPDLAAEHWAAIADQQPGYRQAAWKAGIANLELGRTDAAISQIEAYLKLSDAVPEARITLVQAYLQKELSRPAGDRNWSAFQTALALAKVQLPDQWEWQLAEVAYIASQPTADAKELAGKRLLELDKAFPQNITLCERSVIMFQQLGMSADAESLLKRYDELQSSVARRAMLRSSILVGTNRLPEAIRLLSDTATQVSGSERRDLALVRIKLLLASQQLPQAQELAAQLIAEEPTDIQLLTSGLEIATSSQRLCHGSEMGKGTPGNVGLG